MQKFFSLIAVLSLALASFAGVPANGHKMAIDTRLARPATSMPALQVAPQKAPAAALKAPAAALTTNTLAIDTVAVTYYSSSYYSSTGKYDYYFAFGSKTSDYPLLYIDLYLPTDTGLVGGYYTATDGSIDLDAIILCQDNTDYYYVYFGYSNYTFTDAVLQIDDNGDGTWTFNVILTDDSGNTYEFEITQAVTCGTSTYNPSDSGDDDYDWGDDDEDAYAYDENSDVTKTYTTADSISITDYIADYGCLYFVADAYDGSDELALEFIVSAADANTVIPAGTYTIDDSGSNGTVLASSGYDGSYVYDAYYATLTDYYGELYINQVWFIVSGSVTVTAQNNKLAKIVVNGVNSLGNSVTVTYDATASAVENLSADDDATRKVIENGNLFILRNGVRYNALGAQVE